MESEQSGRVRHLANQLRAASAFKGQFGPPKPLEERMNRLHTPGVSFAVIEQYRLEATGCFGIMSVETLTPVTTETLFQSASISKLVFAVAALRLVQDGVLELDADLSRWLRSWQIPDNQGWRPRVTLRQLLTHTAGFTMSGVPGYTSDEPMPSARQILRGEHPAYNSPVRVNILPGLSYRYAGGGTTVGQVLLEEVTGLAFPELMRQLVLEPLGMTDSTYEQNLPQDLEQRAATAHPWKGVPLPGRYHRYPAMAAAGLWTTPSDLCRLGIALMRAWQGQPNTLLTQATVRGMLQSPLTGPAEGDRHAGLGVFWRGEENLLEFGHDGWNEGFVSVLRLAPQRGQGVAVMLNSNEGHALLEEVLRAIGEEYGWPKAKEELPGPIPLDDEQAWTGDFCDESGRVYQVQLVEGRLGLRLEDQPLLPLWRSSILEFRGVALNLQLTFDPPEHGRSSGFTLSQAGRSFHAKRR